MNSENHFIYFSSKLLLLLDVVVIIFIVSLIIFISCKMKAVFVWVRQTMVGFYWTKWDMQENLLHFINLWSTNVFLRHQQCQLRPLICSPLSPSHTHSLSFCLSVCLSVNVSSAHNSHSKKKTRNENEFGPELGYRRWRADRKWEKCQRVISCSYLLFQLNH